MWHFYFRWLFSTDSDVAYGLFFLACIIGTEGSNHQRQVLWSHRDTAGNVAFFFRSKLLNEQLWLLIVPIPIAYTSVAGKAAFLGESLESSCMRYYVLSLDSLTLFISWLRKRESEFFWIAVASVMLLYAEQVVWKVTKREAWSVGPFDWQRQWGDWGARETDSVSIATTVGSCSY